MIWFSSDTHYWHANIIKYCDRPFKDVAEMNSTMKTNWNASVKPEDTVYFLGDFSFGSNENTTELLSELNGEKILIKGNHDKGSIGTHIQRGFKEVHTSLIIQIANESVQLCHYPYAPPKEVILEKNLKPEWFKRNPPRKKQWLLHGHVHSKVRYQHEFQIDVGVDAWNFYPASIDEIEEIIYTTRLKGKKHG